MEKIHERTSCALLVGYFGILINNIIYYIYFCAQATRQIFVKERLEAQKAARGNPRVFCFLYKYRQVLGSNGPFFRPYLGKIIARRTNSSYNKELYFSAGESSVEFQMFSMGWLDMNCFSFSLFP